MIVAAFADAIASSLNCILGPGECGKSTIVKQMKIIHGNGYSPEERMTFVSLIQQNIIDSITAMLQALPALQLSFADPALQVLLLGAAIKSEYQIMMLMMF